MSFRKPTSIGQWIALHHDLVLISSHGGLLSVGFETRIRSAVAELCPSGKTAAVELAEKCFQAGVERLNSNVQSIRECMLSSLVVNNNKLEDVWKQVDDLPRMYRRTNRSVVSEASPYLKTLIDTTLGQAKAATLECGDVNTISKSCIAPCFQAIAEAIVTTYIGRVEKMLAAVSKMEESLKRLKEAKRSKGAGEGVRQGEESRQQQEDGAMSDDDKIRYQLRVDVERFIKILATEYHIDSDGVPLIDKLSQTVSNYKLMNSAV